MRNKVQNHLVILKAIHAHFPKSENRGHMIVLNNLRIF